MKRAASDTALPHGLPKMQRVDLTEDIPEFVGLKGQLLVDAIFHKYGQGVSTIPWLNEDTKEKNIKPDPVNRPVMESLAEAYMDRILTSGLNVDCSGQGFSKPVQRFEN